MLNEFDGRPDLVSGERTIHNVTDFLHSPLPDEEDEKLLDEFDLGVVFTGTEPRFQMSDTVQITDKNRILLVCVIVSLLLHFGLAYAIPRLIGVSKEQSLLKPGEVVQPVRIVQQPATPKLEPPPENPAVISEHNHITEKERKPKAPPAEKPPLGKPQQMASLTPPVAPDVDKPVDEPKTETKPKEETKKPVERPKPKPSTNQERKNLAPDKTKEVKEPSKRQATKKPQPRTPDLRPTREDYQTAFGPPVGVPDFYPDGDVDEAVVDLNAKEDNRYYSYLIYLKQRIQGVWQYPRSAAQSGTGGTLTVEFSIAKNGELLFVNLLDSSGHSILDDSAMNAIHSAAPYRPLPDRLRAKRLRIRANFIYVTKSSFFGRIM